MQEWGAEMTGMAACGRTKFAPAENLEEKGGTLGTAYPTFLGKGGHFRRKRAQPG